MTDHDDEFAGEELPTEVARLRVDVGEQTGRSFWRSFVAADPGEPIPVFESLDERTAFAVDVRLYRYADHVECLIGIQRPVGGGLVHERLSVDQTDEGSWLALNIPAPDQPTSGDE